MGQAPHGQANIASGGKKVPHRRHVAGPERSLDLLGCKQDRMAPSGERRCAPAQGVAIGNGAADGPSLDVRLLASVRI